MVKYLPVIQLESNGLFRDCFSQSALHVLHYFGEVPRFTELCLLHPFVYSPEKMTFQARRTVTRNDFAYLMERAGIEYCEKVISSNITDNIIADLDTDRIVILAIDCFYDKMQKFTFGRIHQKHYITVIDYEAEQNSFKVVKHDYVNEDDYRIEDMTAGQLASCCTSNCKNILDTTDTYICFRKKAAKLLTNPKKEREYLCSLTDRYQDFLHSVDTFCRMFQQKVKANTESADFSPFVKTINEIYLVKKRIAEYCWQPVSTNVYMTIQKIAFAWRSFLHATLCIIKSQNWGRDMQLQPYFDRIISYEEELLSMVKADCENRYSSESKMVNQWSTRGSKVVQS